MKTKYELGMEFLSKLLFDASYAPVSKCFDDRKCEEKKTLFREIGKVINWFSWRIIIQYKNVHYRFVVCSASIVLPDCVAQRKRNNAFNTRRDTSDGRFN